jgi:hypothetical protein
MESTLETSGPRATVTMKCGVRVLVTAPRAKLHDPLDTDAKGSQLLTDDVLRHAATQGLKEKSGAAVL